jgi:hypothetical protein
MPRDSSGGHTRARAGALLGLAAVAAAAGCGGNRADDFAGTFTGTLTATYMTAPPTTLTYSQVMQIDQGEAPTADVLFRFEILIPSATGGAPITLDCVLPAKRTGDTAAIAANETCAVSLATMTASGSTSATATYTIATGTATVTEEGQLTADVSGTLSGMATGTATESIGLTLHYVGTQR